jgi:phenylacetyl-CoA:acceptor oxidoreductase 27-kDa subunit
MVVDLRKCVGCATCKEVCSLIREMPAAAHWRKIVQIGGEGPGRESGAVQRYLSMSCMQCAQAPCLEICPTQATFRRADGIIDIHKSSCIGCAACVVACPYHARTICEEDSALPGQETLGKTNGAEAAQQRIGTCTKCNFCCGLIDEGMAKGLRPGVDAEATPLCVRFCIGEALCFGDLDDEESCVSRLIRDHKATRLSTDLGTEPNVYVIVE